MPRSQFLFLHMRILLWLVGLFVVLAPIGYYFIQPEEKPLPVLNPADLNPATVDPEMLRLGYGHEIASFSFLNQDSVMVSSSDHEGKIWVAEYFFTTCGSICPLMNAQMRRVQEAFKDANDIQIFSFSVDPEHDTPSVLKKYAVRHGARPNIWQFLTGNKDQLYTLARRSFFLLKPAEVAKHGDGNSDFIHTNNFVLVDHKKRIRGYYDGTSIQEVDQMIQDIKKLQTERL